jgi:predicted transcriptional regulator
MVKAGELAQSLPTVSVDDSALEAAQLIVANQLPGIAVLSAKGEPVTVLAASDVLSAVVPAPIREDPSLAGVLDERSADLCAGDLARRRVGELIRPERHRVELASVEPDATVVECAAVMARSRSPLLLVAAQGKRGDRVLGLLTASHLLEVLLSGHAGSAK